MLKKPLDNGNLKYRKKSYTSDFFYFFYMTHSITCISAIMQPHVIHLSANFTERKHTELRWQKFFETYSNLLRSSPHRYTGSEFN